MKNVVKNGWLFVVALAIISSLVALAKETTSPKNSFSCVEKQHVMVFAAASLSEVLAEIADSFEVQYTVKININTASSGTLARQITQGELPDIFISASENWMMYVDSLGFVQKGSVVEVARNSLVLIAPKESNVKPAVIDASTDIVSMLHSGRLSMGDPAHVPAGKYAQQSLEYFGWYKLLYNKILPAKDVRSSLMVIAMGEAPLGIVYHTDIVQSNSVTVIGSFPECSHGPIVYTAGLCRSNEAGTMFYQSIKSEKSDPIWLKYGFKRALTIDCK